MKDENMGRLDEDALRAGPVFTCQVCGKRATNWRDVSEGLAPGSDKWVSQTWRTDMNMQNLRPITWQMPRLNPRLSCEACTDEAAYLRNVGNDLDVGREIWVARCENCRDVEMRTA
jgi:hypothetical protein